MHTDNDLGNTGVDANMDLEDENQEKSMQWLLDMDLSEPEENLFAVAGDEYHDEGLSAYEAEVAGRPLTRGNASSDDLSTYVAEEIVISSDTVRSDIYADTDASDAAEEETAAKDEVMAIDYSLGRAERDEEQASASVDEGVDILGLASEDDMGEKFLAIKRVKATAVEQQAVSPRSVETTTDSQRVPAQAETVVNEGEAPAEIGESELELSAESLEIDSDFQQPGEDGLVLETDLPCEMNLTEAPVLTQVADPQLDEVANEGCVPEESLDTEGVDLEEGVELSLAADYLANLEQQDDDFDQLVAGSEAPLDIESSLEELTVEPEECAITTGTETDTSTEFTIDYHEDFRSMEGFAEESLTGVAAVIPPVIEEITRRAQARTKALGLAAEAPVVEVMLGVDEESIKQCYAQGYEPVSSVCSELPDPLRAFDASECDTLYVRILGAEGKESWNHLLSPDFVAANADESSVADEQLADIEFDLGDFENAGLKADTALEAELDEGFDDDVFGQDFSEDFSAEFTTDPTASAMDIEDAFSGMSDVGEDEVTVEGFGAAGNLSLEDVVQVQESTLEQSVEIEKEVAAEESVEEAEVEAVALVSETDDLATTGQCGVAWCIPEGIEFSYTRQGTTEIFADFLDAFIEEASEEVEKLENVIGEWEKDVAAEAVYAEVSRTLHTIKGIAKSVGLQRYGTLVHNFETLLEAMPRPKGDDTQMYFRIVNAWLDAVVRGVEFVSGSRADIASELPAAAAAVDTGSAELVAVETLEEAPEQQEEEEQEAEEQGAEASIEESLEAINERKSTVLAALEKKRDQKLADEGAKALAAQQSVRITSEKLDHLLNLASQAQQLGVRASQNTSRSKRSSAELQGRLTSVRSHIGKIADRALLNVNAKNGGSTAELDALEMDQYSELQEAASILREGVEDLADLVDVVSRQNTQIEALLKQQSSVISSISSSVQGARVVPMSRLMPGLRRIVRTVSNDLGKVVAFKVLNETGALDRDHYARLQVVMEHMVRNAMDHGIESPEERVAAGKTSGGRITVDVRKSGGDYVIRLSDDGKGIDPDAIRQSAYEKGLDVDVDSLSDEEVIRLIFHKGFSTAATVSEISGRGVGMDIVLTELQQIGGDIHIQSAIGLGTTFEVRIPSNVSVNGALLVAAGDESYAIPLNGLIAVEQVPVDEFYAAVEKGTNLSLFEAQCEPAYLPTLCQGLGLPDRAVWDAFVPVIIAGDDHRQMAIAIDNVEEALELVVRSLGSQFASVPGVAGAATTADGEAIVALDLNLLVSSVGAEGIAPIEVTQAEDSRLLALVVDDSRTQRMVATSQLDTVGVETITAENGLVAIDLLNAAHRLPDVVLLDVEMPVKDGMETLREIRKSRRYGHLPVIMVTSRTGAKHRALAKEAGCNAYMGKPFNFPALIGQINDLTGHELQLS